MGCTAISNTSLGGGHYMSLCTKNWIPKEKCRASWVKVKFDHNITVLPDMSTNWKGTIANLSWRRNSEVLAFLFKLECKVKFNNWASKEKCRAELSLIAHLRHNPKESGDKLEFQWKTNNWAVNQANWDQTTQQKLLMQTSKPGKMKQEKLLLVNKTSTFPSSLNYASQNITMID